jgi:PAS domain S-box-containing protein
LIESFPSDMQFVRALECLLENANDAFYILDQKGRVAAANRKAEILVGIKRRNLLGKSFRKIARASTLPISVKSLMKTPRKKPITFELEFGTATAKTIIVESTLMPCFSHGEFLGILGIIRDITERREMEKALRQSEKRFRSIVENSPSGIGIIDDHFKITYINNEACRILGRPRNEIVGKDYRRFLDKESRAFVQDSYLRRQRGERVPSRYECKVVRKDGERRTIENTSIAIRGSNGKTQSIAQILDITEQKRSEEKLSKEKKKFQTLFSLMIDPVIILDGEGRILQVSRGAARITGYRKTELLGKNLFKTNILTPATKAIMKTSFSKRMSGRKVPPYEIEAVRKDGKRLRCEVNATRIEYEGKPADMIVVRDITERKKTEDALRDSEGKFRAISASARDGIVLTKNDGKIVYCNPAAEKTLGYTKDEMIGKRLHVLLRSQPFYRDFVKLYRRFQVMGGKALNGKTLELQFTNKDGIVLPVELSVSAFQMKGKWHALAIVRDVTERKKLEERLSALNYYGGKLNRAQNIQQIYKLTLDAIEKTLGFENAAFMVVEKGCLQVGDKRGHDEPKTRMPLNGKGISVKAANNHRPVIVPDVRKDKDYVLGVPNVQSEVAVPIETEDGVIGVLDVESKELGAFDEKDAMLLEILASHAATAIGNLEKRAEVEKRHSQLTLLMNSSAEMIHTTRLPQRLQKIAEAIRQLGWQRVVIRAVKDLSMDLTNPEDMVTAGLTDEEREFLWTNRMPGQVWRERFGPEFERFRVGEFYHLPWSDPWVRKKFAQGTVSSRLSPEEMVDWDPQDLLYAPLRLADGRIVGILSIDDPVNGKRPTKESLAPLELFIHQAAVAIENAQLIQQLNTARNQIREYADQLELKVKQRTQELVEAQSKLIKTERLATIGEVAGMVGHDLRNPLTGITGATYYLRMKLGSRLNSKAKEMLELIDRDIEHANKIINDLLDYSKEIFLETKETTVKSIVEESLSLVKVPKNIKVLNLTEDEPRIQADAEKMRRVFVNIVQNAVDAMPKGGTITITCAGKDDFLEIAIADTGMGMTKEVLKKIWSPLFTTKAKGMGFGLPICKRVAEAHGGSISVESVVGAGTVFKLTLPKQPKIEEGGEKVWVNVPESLLSMTTKA